MSARATELGAARRRAEALQALRTLRGSGTPSARRAAAERCDLCGRDLPADHRHLLQTVERTILCTCEPCWALRAGDAGLRPVGTRVVPLPDLDLPGELWASFGVPVGLAFFMRSSATRSVVAFYPSPAGATESELELGDWARLVTRNPALADLETDAEALIADRTRAPHRYAIAPIDRCYELVGAIKVGWQGISGGDVLDRVVPAFFDRLLGEGEGA